MESVIAMTAAQSIDNNVSNLSVGADPIPMNLAPIGPGERFGPCLLYARGYSNSAMTNWFVGSWDGEDWYQLGTGLIVSEPIAWRPMPKDPSWR